MKIRRFRLRSLTLAAAAATVAPFAVATMAAGAGAATADTTAPGGTSAGITAGSTAGTAGAVTATAGTKAAGTKAAGAKVGGVAVAAAKTFTIPFSGLTATPVLSGLSQPAAFRFAPGNRIFVASKPGVVEVFDGPGDATATTSLDIREEVYDQGGRGLVGLALDPSFTDKPFLYLLYSYDRDPFGTAAVPRWGTKDGGDACPEKPGATADGCTSSVRLVRYRVDAAGVADPASKTVLLDGAGNSEGGWCQQFPENGAGSVEFGPDGALYVGVGDGASTTAVDYGQFGGSADSPTPANPCADAPAGRGEAQTPTTSLGGALRAQGVRGAAADGYVSWDGAILRLDPATGAAATGNPLVGNGVGGDDRIVAYGLRNPYRFGFRPGTGELWLGDRGWTAAQEIDTFTTGMGQTTVPNFGWPCHEGTTKQAGFDTADINLCESLYATPESKLGGVTSPLATPYHSWAHDGAQPATGCASTAGGAAVGGRFVSSTAWPASLSGAYVFADAAHGCIAAMPKLSTGKPNTSQRFALVTNTSATDLQTGPGGDIYWIDGQDGSINRLRPSRTNVPPVARFTATPANGPAPLTVHLDASTTTDANEGEVITYRWETNGGTQCDDATGQVTDVLFPKRGTYTIILCATDQLGQTGVARTTVVAGNAMPVITTLTSSADANGWKVGDLVTLTANATDDVDTLGDSAFTWQLEAVDCGQQDGAGNCHAEPMMSLPDGKTTSFTTPDGPYGAFLRAKLTVTDSEAGTSTKSIDLKPRTSDVTVATEPAGIPVTIGSTSGDSPQSSKFLENGLVQVIVPTTTTVGDAEYRFTGWSDGEIGVVRQLPAPAGATTITALYEEVPNALPTVTGVTVSPGSIATGPGTVNVVVTATIGDDSGVADAEARVRLADGTEFTAGMIREQGSVVDGFWTATIGIPYGSPGGTYTTSVVATDDEGAIGIGSGPNLTVRARTCVLWWCW